jgi:hypothetical protein
MNQDDKMNPDSLQQPETQELTNRSQVNSQTSGGSNESPVKNIFAQAVVQVDPQS